MINLHGTQLTGTRLRFSTHHKFELSLPVNHGNFVHQQNGYSRQRDPSGQRIASQEVEGHARPAGANRYQSAADIERSHCGREVRAMDVPEPEELT